MEKSTEFKHEEDALDVVRAKEDKPDGITATGNTKPDDCSDLTDNNNDPEEPPKSFPQKVRTLSVLRC